MATMLQLITQATQEMGLLAPNSVAGNLATDTIQQLALLNAAGYELQREYDWQALVGQNIFQVSVINLTGDTVEGSNQLTNASTIVGVTDDFQIVGSGMNQATYVTGAAGATITLSQPATSTNVGASYVLTQVKYDMPADYDRQINRTHWDKSKHWEMLGPETPQQWEWLISGYISTGPRVRYRIFGGQFQIWPALGVNEVLGFEYQSKAWVRAADGTPKNSFTVDTDTCIFPDRLMVLALKKKYFEVKGFDTTALMQDYMTHLDIAKANDSGAASLSFAPRISTILIGFEQIPDSGYGS